MGHAKTVDDLRLLSKSFGQQNGFRVTTNGNNKIKYIHGLLSGPNYQDVNSIQNFLKEYKTAFGFRSVEDDLAEIDLPFLQHQAPHSWGFLFVV